VICSDGKLHGLLLKAELEDKHFEPETKVEKIADVAPACIGDEWPLERAHHLFTALGLRHLLVIDRDGRPVGMLTRHDLQEHGHEHAHGSRPTIGLGSVARADVGVLTSCVRTAAREQRRAGASSSRCLRRPTAPTPSTPPPRHLRRWWHCNRASRSAFSRYA
jgi:hypothetical protein